MTCERGGHRRWRVLIGIAAVLAIGGSCGSRGESETATWEHDVALIPSEAAAVFRADLGRLRTSPVWQRLASLAQSDPARQHAVDELVRRTGLDPARQIQTIVWAQPASGAEFALIVRGGPFDEAKLVAFATEQLQHQGLTLVSSDVGTKKVYSDGRERIFVALLDRSTLVVGSKRWTQRVIELGSGTSTENVLRAPAWAAL